MLRPSPPRRQNPDLNPQIDLLVRPGRQVLVPGLAEDLLYRQAGAGSGRVGKDLVTGADVLRRTMLTARGNRAGDLPMLLSVNQEGGRLNALDWPEVTQLPGNLALGATADEDLAEMAGAAIGGQLRALGLTWALAPVCDIAGWPSAAAIGTRSFGCDPEQVAQLGAAFVRGMQAQQVAATAKHFPGLGGVTADPHHVAPVVDRLAPGALLPFQAVIAEQVACVMIGSHTVLALDDRPALASRRVLGLLRDELGFDGVTVSENLSLRAVHEPLGGLPAAAVAAVVAGVDVVMLDSEISRGRSSHGQRVAAAGRRVQVVQALADAVAQGTISRERIDEAARRVRAMHRRFGLVPQTALPEWAVADAAAEHAAARIAGAAVTVVRGADLLPLHLAPGQPLCVVRVPDAGERRADSARHAPDLLPDLLGACQRVRQVPPGEPAAGPTVVYGYDTRSDPRQRSGAAQEAARLTAAGCPVAQIAFGDLDDLTDSPAPVLIAAFSPHHASVAATASILLDGHRAPGVLPIVGASW